MLYQRDVRCVAEADILKGNGALGLLNSAKIAVLDLNLLIKQGKKRLLLPLAIIVATFIANLCFDVNIMVLIIIDGIIGFAFMRDKKYD